VERARSKFAGGDQRYLRDEQYSDASRLKERANLHTKYGTSSTPWFDWIAECFDLQPSMDILEAGCGAGWVWADTKVPIPAGSRLTLTDLSPGMVDEAVERVEQSEKFASVQGQPADLQSLPFEANSFHRVIANHMLYHLPEPRLGIAELSRVVRPGGTVIAATNGLRHMRQLWKIRGEVFDIPATDRTIDVFGADCGFALLRERFDDVRWLAYRDELRCTDPDDVLAYVCSTPPGEDATPTERRMLVDLIRSAFEAGNGTMTITKDVGCFSCRSPVR